MQGEELYQRILNGITHSPYYGCTVRVVSKAGVSYEGVLDGISSPKDRIFLKNVRVNGNLTSSLSNRSDRITNDDGNDDDANRNSTSDKLNAVMIDHLTNDIHTYEQVCLNVRDIKELRLIQLPSTFHESRAKLRAIDPCLLDIRLSPSDEYETRSNGSNTDKSQRAPIAPRQKRGHSFGSTGGGALISSSSNESSSSFGLRSDERFTLESNDESTDEGLDKFNQLSITHPTVKPATLLAKKVLPKKIERRSDMSTIKTNNNLRLHSADNRETSFSSTRTQQQQQPETMKKGGATIQPNRKTSPIRVTITSTLNPDAVPFYTQQRNAPPPMPNSTFKFYDRAHFRPRLQPIVSPDRSQSLPYGMNAFNIPPPPPQHHQQQQPYQFPNHQRFIPPRQMALKKTNTQTKTNPRPIRAPPPPVMKYRVHPSISMDRRIYPQQQQQQQQNKSKPSNNNQFPGYMRQASLPSSDQLVETQAIQGNFTAARNIPTRRSTASIRSTSSLPYQYNNPNDHGQQLLTPLSYTDSVGSRSNRTFSCASSCSSLSVDMMPHSLVRKDLSSSPSNPLPSFEEQYDFEKANEEFRRYLELEELVVRCPSISESNTPPQDHQQLQQSNSYKKEISFFDRISCTATTGTAVGYTEMDETEKNLETFGDDALLISSSIPHDDDEWQL